MASQQCIRRFGRAIFILVALLVWQDHSAWAAKAERIQGEHCYPSTKLDPHPLLQKSALIKARERALAQHSTFKANQKTLESLHLQENVLQNLSLQALDKENVETTQPNDHTFCVRVSAKVESTPLQREISRWVSQRKIKTTLEGLIKPLPSDEGLTIWLDQPDGIYTEGEYLVVYVKSEQDVYLKLDYFQTDGKVVHMVPNVFRAQAYIKKNQTYEFGGENSPERFVVREPFGEETIKAIGSIRPFVMGPPLSGKTSESEAYLQTLQQAIEQQPRGVMIVSGSTASIRTISRDGAMLEATPKHR